MFWLCVAVLAAVLFWQRRPVLFWLMETCLWVWFLRWIVRNLRLSWGPTRMTALKYHAVLRTIKKGDVIMGIDYRKPGHRATPGEMAHGALCVDVSGVEPVIAEMVGEGFQLVHLSEFCFHSDRVLTLECTDWDGEYIDGVLVPACLGQGGAEYDNQFRLRFGRKLQYCFELPHTADKQGRLRVVYDSFFGRRVLTADSYLRAPNARVTCDTDWPAPSLTDGA